MGGANNGDVVGTAAKVADVGSVFAGGSATVGADVGVAITGGGGFENVDTAAAANSDLREEVKNVTACTH